MSDEQQFDIAAAFSERLLGALRQFDAAYPPFGLYASNEIDAPVVKRISEYREWDLAIRPFLAEEAADVGPFFPPTTAHAGIEGIGRVRIALLRLSKIKVRQYGSRFHIDKHVAFPARWAQLNLEDKIRRLWKRTDRPSLHMSVIVLAGFDKAADPLREELSVLEESLRWEQHGVIHTSMRWLDVHDRGFNVHLSAWARHSADGLAW